MNIEKDKIFLKQFITKQIPDKFQQIKDNFSNIITLAQSKKDLDIIKHKFEKFISIKNNSPIAINNNSLKDKIRISSKIPYNNKNTFQISPYNIIQISTDPSLNNRNIYNNINIYNTTLKNEFRFLPIYQSNEQLVFQDIQKIYKEQFKESLQKPTKNYGDKLTIKYQKYIPERDIQRTPGKFEKFLLLSGNKLIQESNKAMSVLKYYADRDIINYTQMWDFTYSIAYILAKMR